MIRVTSKESSPTLERQRLHLHYPALERYHQMCMTIELNCIAAANERAPRCCGRLESYRFQCYKCQTCDIRRHSLDITCILCLPPSTDWDWRPCQAAERHVGDALLRRFSRDNDEDLGKPPVLGAHATELAKLMLEASGGKLERAVEMLKRVRMTQNKDAGPEEVVPIGVFYGAADILKERAMEQGMDTTMRPPTREHLCQDEGYDPFHAQDV